MFRYVLIETDEKYSEILALYQRNKDYFALNGTSKLDLVQVDEDVHSGPAHITPENKKYFFVIRGYQGESLLDYKKQEVYNGYISYLKSITNKLSISVLIISYS